jgi:hypothetical protein
MNLSLSTEILLREVQLIFPVLAGTKKAQDEHVNHTAQANMGVVKNTHTRQERPERRVEQVWHPPWLMMCGGL